MAKTLLLADDSITIQKVVNLTFAEEDIEVESVTNGDQAVDKAREIRPAIVLADVIMPGRNGYEVCASIKADPDLSAIPVILLVGTFEPFDEAEASRVKCDAYLTKPFDTSELIEMVHSLIEKATGNGSFGGGAEDEATGGVRPVQQAHEEGLVSNRAMESFLGSGSILDLFGPLEQQVVPKTPMPEVLTESQDKDEAEVEVSKPPLLAPDAPEESADSPQSQLHVIPFPAGRSNAADSESLSLSEEVLDTIVERVVQRMSHDVIREVAWEVVPELSEIIIRQLMEERTKKDK